MGDMGINLPEAEARIIEMSLEMIYLEGKNQQLRDMLEKDDG